MKLTLSSNLVKSYVHMPHSRLGRIRQARITLTAEAGVVVNDEAFMRDV